MKNDMHFPFKRSQIYLNLSEFTKGGYYLSLDEDLEGLILHRFYSFQRSIFAIIQEYVILFNIYQI